MRNKRPQDKIREATKNEPTRQFEEIFNNHNKQDKQITKNRENYGYKE